VLQKEVDDIKALDLKKKKFYEQFVPDWKKICSENGHNARSFKSIAGVLNIKPKPLIGAEIPEENPAEVARKRIKNSIVRLSSCGDISKFLDQKENLDRRNSLAFAISKKITQQSNSFSISGYFEDKIDPFYLELKETDETPDTRERAATGYGQRTSRLKEIAEKTSVNVRSQTAKPAGKNVKALARI
jgi:hypothetical protein